MSDSPPPAAGGEGPHAEDVPPPSVAAKAEETPTAAPSAGEGAKPVAKSAGDGGTDPAPVTREAVSTEPAAGSQEKTLALLCHLLAFAGFVFPFGNLVGPLILWLLQREKSEVVDREGQASINFQICVSLAVIAMTILWAGVTFTLGWIPILGTFASFAAVLLPGVVVVSAIVFVILSVVRVNEGKPSNYPFTYDFLSLFLGDS